MNTICDAVEEIGVYLRCFMIFNLMVIYEAGHAVAKWSFRLQKYYAWRSALLKTLTLDTYISTFS